MVGGRRAPLVRAGSLSLHQSLVGKLLYFDLGRAILHPYHRLHKMWEEVAGILSPFFSPCYVGSCQENLRCREGASRRRYETRELSSQGLLLREKVEEMVTAPGMTSVGRR